MNTTIFTYTKRLFYVLFFCVCHNTIAQTTTLSGPVKDYGFTDKNNSVCCIDVAAVNLLNYLDSQKGNESLIPDGKSIDDQQIDFHKIYDEDFSKTQGSRAELVKALEETLKSRSFNASVKSFLTKDLDYDKLVNEWKHGELIIVLAKEVDQGFGHALFLWGINLDGQSPSLAVADPNIEPNSDFISGMGGMASWSNLAISRDSNNFPDWRIQLTGTETYNYRITSFVSVSDVSPIPEPKVWQALIVGLLIITVSRGRLARKNQHNGQK